MLWPLGSSLLAVDVIYHWHETTGKSGSLTQWMEICCPRCASRMHRGTSDLIYFYKWYFICTKTFYNSHNYADNNTLLNTYHSIAELKYNLETSTTVAIHRLNVNGMKSNQAKFQDMFLNNHPDTSDISLCVNDMNIPLKPCVKWLGVLLDYRRNFLDHVTYVCKRASRQLNAVRRVANILTKIALWNYFMPLSYPLSVTVLLVKYYQKGRNTKVALRMVFNDHDADYNKLLSMSDDEAFSRRTT